MQNEKLTNLYIWIGVLLALAGYGQQLTALSGAYVDHETEANILSQVCYLGSWIFFIVDYFKLKANGLSRPHWAWVALYGLFPVYLWKRSSLLGINRKPFWTFVCTLVVFIGLTLLTSIILDPQQSSASSDETCFESRQQLTKSDRKMVKEWLQGMSAELDRVGLVSANIPVYYNKTNNCLLGFIRFKNIAYIFASSGDSTQIQACQLFSEFSYIDGKIIVAECPYAEGAYNNQTDSFVFGATLDDCGLCTAGAVLQGHYERVATGMCKMTASGEFVVAQVFTN